MELSSFDIKKKIIFSQKKAFLIFQEMELPSSNIKKKNYVFSKESFFLYFLKKHFSYFLFQKLFKNPYISGNGTFVCFKKRIFRILA